MGDPLSVGEQISLLLFMIIASKGAAGVTGAGLATLADGDDVWLCRCGRSGSKPFCDASHKGQFESRLVQVEGERRQAETPAAFEPNPGVQPPPEAAG